MTGGAEMLLVGAAGLGAGLVAAVVRSRSATAVPVPTAQVKAIIRAEFEGSSIPVWFALTCAALESGFDEAAQLRGPRDDSHGLYQLNMLVPDFRTAMEAEGLQVSDLYDPAVNARFWHVHVANVFRAGAVRRGYSGDRLWEAVRLRCGGIGWDYIAGGGANDAVRAKAAAMRARLWRYAARFRT